MLKFDWNILWTLINLVFFFLLMKMFLFKPIKKVLDKRQQLIDEQFKNAEDTNAQAQAVKAEYENALEGADDEAKKIITDARESAKAEYSRIIDKAEDDARQLRLNAEKQIAQETESARRAAKEEIAELAIKAAEKVVGKSVDAQTDSDIFDEFLNEGSVE